MNSYLTASVLVGGALTWSANVTSYWVQVDTYRVTGDALQHIKESLLSGHLMPI
jgi:hypothetical protein